MKKIAFLISSSYKLDLEKTDGKFFNEFEFFEPLFEEKGCLLEKVIWDEKTDWAQFHTVIFKSIWDYYEKPEKFKSLLKELDKYKINYCNDLKTVLWNMEKTYLTDIQKMGLPVIPFFLITDLKELDDQFFSQFAEEIILKPTISGGSRNTVKIKTKEWKDHLDLMRTILSESKLLIQPFIAEVAIEGEYSFLFFNNQFSHAILKKPKSGDFRAHSYFGGNNYKIYPSNTTVEEVKKFLSTAPNLPKYARVDVVLYNGEYHLMELELIEPYLYLECAIDSESAGMSFVDGIMS